MDNSTINVFHTLCTKWVNL